MPPAPPRLLQLRAKPSSVGVQFGVTVSHGPQVLEHDGHIPRHADLIGLGVIGLRPHFLQFVL